MSDQVLKHPIDLRNVSARHSMGPKNKSKGGKATRPKAVQATKPSSSGTPVLSDNSSHGDVAEDLAAELQQFDEEEVRRIREAPVIQRPASEEGENSDYDGGYEYSPMRSFASSSAHSAKYYSSSSPDRSKDDPQAPPADGASDKVGDDLTQKHHTALEQHSVGDDASKHHSPFALNADREKKQELAANPPLNAVSNDSRDGQSAPANPASGEDDDVRVVSYTPGPGGADSSTQTKSATLGEMALLSPPGEREGAGENFTTREIPLPPANTASGQPSVRANPPDTPPRAVQNIEHAALCLRTLLQAGHSLSDASNALEKTKIDGQFNVTRAEAYLQSALDHLQKDQDALREEHRKAIEELCNFRYGQAQQYLEELKMFKRESAENMQHLMQQQLRQQGETFNAQLHEQSQIMHQAMLKQMQQQLQTLQTMQAANAHLPSTNGGGAATSKPSLPPLPPAPGTKAASPAPAAAPPPPYTVTDADLLEAHNVGRLEYLIRKGWKAAHATEALKLTAIGRELSSGRAEEHLRAKEIETRKETLQAAQVQMADGLDIPADSDIALILGRHPDALSAAVKLLRLHQAKRTVHNAKSYVSALQLLQLSEAQNDPTVKRVEDELLTKIAIGAAEICGTCKGMREKAAKEEQEAEAKKLKQQEASAKKRPRSKKVQVNFKEKDSLFDPSFPITECAICNLGEENGAYLYICDFCRAGSHLTCDELVLLQSNLTKKEYWACTQCREKRERLAVTQGNAFTDSDATDGKAPTKGRSKRKTVDGPLDRKPHSDSLLERYGGGGAAAATPPHGKLEITVNKALTGTLGTPAKLLPFSSSEFRTPGAGNLTLESGIDPNFTGNPPLEGANPQSSRTLIRQDDYVQWVMVPEGSKPGEHPTKGWGKVPYLHWKNTNVQRRDATKANHGNLGRFTVRALSQDMRIAVGGQLMQLPKFWPKPDMTDADHNARVDNDPLFEWVKQVSDEDLLNTLDAHFGVTQLDPFLSKKFPSNLPLYHSNGDINYCSAELNTFLTEWQTGLAELRSGKCDLSSIDLKQTLLNGLVSHPTIHEQAQRYASTSVHMIIAHLRSWVQKEEELQASARSKRERLAAKQAFTEDGAIERSKADAKPEKTGAAALLTAVEGLKTSIDAIRDKSGGAAASTGGNASKPKPKHLMPHQDPGKVECQGCGNVWREAMRVPCWNACKYSEHPLYNKDCKTKKYKGKQPLTWKNFRAEYSALAASPQCPSAFLAYEERAKHQQPNKTNRDGDSTPDPKRHASDA